MKEQTKKRAVSLMIALVMALGTVFVTTGQAEAAPKAPAKLIPAVLWEYSNTYGSATIEFKNWRNEEKATLISVKSSNPKVIEARKDGTKMYEHMLQPKKAGKSVITMKYKLKGQTYTLKETFVVKKYPNPLKSIKINDKKINLKNNKYLYWKGNYKKTSVKLQYQPKAGWKVVDAHAYMENDKVYKDKPVKKKAVPNGVTVAFPNKFDQMHVMITLQNAKGENFEHGVIFQR